MGGARSGLGRPVASLVMFLLALCSASAETSVAAVVAGPCTDNASPAGLEQAFHLLSDGWDAFPRAQETPALTPPPKPRRHYWAAAGELLALNVGTWVIDRYVFKAPWAVLSADVWKTNLQQGFHWDNDDFQTNQGLHLYHGGAYFSAGRSNGFTFWESAVFPAVGSLMWEYFGENQLPSTNDLINTSLGGITHGEITHRVSTMILDNTASGSTRLLREIGGFLVDPLRGLNRLFRGEMTRDFPNPEDRFPVRFLIELDLGYEHLGYGGPDVVQYPDQSLVSVLVRYGDPFLGENREPFDFLEALIEVGPPSGAIIARRWLERGQLVSWQLSQSKTSEHRLGLFLNYEYINNQAEIFSSQNISANLMSRFPMGRGVDVRTEIAGVFYPITAIQTDYITENFAAVGRPYDYGLGGGAFVRARVQRESLDLFLLGYDVVWSATRNGLSAHSTIQRFRAEGRLPLSGGLALGGAYTWNKRITSYAGLPTVELQGPQWRVFAALLLR